MATDKDEVRKYTAEELEKMRRYISSLYLDNLTLYERLDIAEKMLQTYISQGIEPYELSQMFIKKIAEDKSKIEP